MELLRVIDNFHILIRFALTAVFLVGLGYVKHRRQRNRDKRDSDDGSDRGDSGTK